MKKRAFTLAEVLITLMVIGVLAVITIPSILQSWEEQATVTKLKKTYSILQQAYKLAELENGSPDTWGIKSDGSANPVALNYFKPYLKTLKDCGYNKSGCASDTASPLGYSGTAISLYNSWSKILLLDGIGLYMYDSNPTCQGYRIQDNEKDCAVVMVDLNGIKAPNQLGKDVFRFTLTKKGILATGGNGNSLYNHSSCNNTTGTNGYGCAKWVIERGNMDYLHKTTTW